MKEETKPSKIEVKKEKVKKVKIDKKKKDVTFSVPQVQEVKKPHVSKRQFGTDSKKAKLAVKARQTRWAPVWAVMKKYGTGKRIHPSAMTAYKRNWRKTKLHIKPRRIRKWHLG